MISFASYYFTASLGLLWILHFCSCPFANAWPTTSKALTATRCPLTNRRNSSRQYASHTNEENDEDLKRRMALVRSLQMSYYKPAAGTVDDTKAPSSHSTLDETTGKVHDLPLFRAPWWEVPGRSNVLNIHEPIYTNMFEKLLYGPKPWVFGHLYLEDGSRNLKNCALRSWDDGTKEKAAEPKSAVVGCLMKIADYRRFQDGRLLLLVHAMERFVVTDVVQSLPYSICDAQIVPDAEEIDTDPSLVLSKAITSEADLKAPRALAIQESVQYHDYEYDRDHILPVPDKPDLQVSDITGSDIAKVLPYCPFSKTVEPPTILHDDLLRPSTTTESLLSDKESQDDDNNNEDPSLPSLEYRLLRQGVFQTPLMDPDFPHRNDLTVDELEYELWLSINSFLIQTKTPVSPILLGLLPVHHDVWPDEPSPQTKEVPKSQPSSSSSAVGGITTTRRLLDQSRNNATQVATQPSPITTTSRSLPPPQQSQPFALKQIVKELAQLNSLEHDFVQVSPDYPAHRRQRRLSYAAAHLLERNSQVANDLRAQLLAAPTTQQRLRLVLQGLDQWKERSMGEFQ